MKRRNITIIAVLILLIVLMIAKCNCRTQSKMAVRFVNPPIPSADIPFTDYTVDAANGDTIMYESGSVLMFPKDAFVDKNGKAVQGKVNIKYREFANPADQFLSGIPMGYDSAGVHYTFESAGMCEIQAYKNGAPVFVNKKNKPVINLATSNNDIAQNLYFLDTVTKQWVNRGKSEILVTGNSKTIALEPSSPSISIAKPVKPTLQDDNLPTIKLTVDPASFEELKAYNNLQFQLDKSETRFKPEDANIEWDDIKLEKGNKNGIYTIKFSKTQGKSSKSVEYYVRPVLNEQDYASAMVQYDKQVAEYNKKMSEKKSSYNARRAEYLKDSINMVMIDKENQKTIQLNKIIEAKNAEMEKLNARIEADNKIIDEKNKVVRNYNFTHRLLRSFEIDGFGIWNCDKPFEPGTTSTIKSFYVTTDRKDIKMHSINIIVKDLNGLISQKTDQLNVPYKMDCMLVGVSEGRFAYLTYEEFRSLNISSQTNTQTFPMHIVSEENNNYDYIKNIAKR